MCAIRHGLLEHDKNVSQGNQCGKEPLIHQTKKSLTIKLEVFLVLDGPETFNPWLESQHLTILAPNHGHNQK